MSIQQHLEAFADVANKWGWRFPEAEQMWRKVIIASHLTLEPIEHKDVAERLHKMGFSGQAATILADEYAEGIALLKQYDNEKGNDLAEMRVRFESLINAVHKVGQERYGKELATRIFTAAGFLEQK